MNDIRALVFDVFGTLVDWRGSVAREAREVLAPHGVAVDWHAFADGWRVLRTIVRERLQAPPPVDLAPAPLLLPTPSSGSWWE